MNKLSFLSVKVAANPDDSLARLGINITTFLTILCWIFLLLFMISRAAPYLRAQFANKLDSNVYILLFLVPLVAMGFSLYFSEVLHWIPCKLCIYQRMCIYPLAILMLGYYFWRNKWLYRIGWVLAGICPFISTYHVSLEIKGAESSFCSADVSCSAIWFKSLGFLTIPGMALTASVTICVLLYMVSVVSKKSDAV